MNALKYQFSADNVNAGELFADVCHLRLFRCAKKVFKYLYGHPAQSLAQAYKETFGVEGINFHRANGDAKAVGQLWLYWAEAGKVQWEDYETIDQFYN